MRETASQAGTVFYASAREVGRNLADIENRVAFGRERCLVRRHGKSVAAIVPVADLEQLLAGGPSAAEVVAALRAMLVEPVETSVLASPTSQEGAAR